VSTIVHVREERHDGTVVATVEGEVDTASVGEVAVKLRRIAENKLHRVVIDLTAVTYLDSAGINLLYAVRGDVQARQQELHLVVSPGSPIERMLTIVGADRAFPVHASLDDALATAR
jgi:stage II sporulation protein AA (anti-sigma F factor antagonist)